MSLTKADIIEDIHKNCGFTKSKSAELTESILEIIKHSLRRTSIQHSLPDLFKTFKDVLK